MPFLSGSLSFERFHVDGFDASAFDDEHLALLAKHCAGRFETTSEENTHVGFLGGGHLFEQKFDLEKNLINEAVHCSVRIDTNEVPSAIRKAWLEMELIALVKDSPTGKISKSQKKEAKEAMEQRCVVEAETGRFRKMSQMPFLWDLRQGLLLFGGSAGSASGHCADLLETTFGVQLRHIGCGSIAQAWAEENELEEALDNIQPSAFIPSVHRGQFVWANEHSQAPDYLGNEFMLWLWWTLENKTDTIALSDETEVTVMMNKTLSLECPNGESGKETISSECPIQLPEAMKAVQSGKMPRKCGLSLIREGQQYDLVLQAESFGISGAKIKKEDDDDDRDASDRIDAIRSMTRTVDLLFHAFCARRVSDAWNDDQREISQWLESPSEKNKKIAA